MLYAPALTESIDHLIEANTALRKRRALAPLERQLAAAMRLAFLRQGRAFVKRLELVRGQFAEAASEGSWGPLFDEAALETLDAFANPLTNMAEAALAAGLRAAFADLAAETSFDLSHPRAVTYLQRRGGDRITQITETTRARTRAILVQAADEGWGYTRTAKALKALFSGFAGPPLAVQPKHLRSRAEAIAVYELGDAYEAANRMVAEDLQDAGLDMQKRWLTVGDSRVRPEHAENQGAEWIPLDDAFPSGHDRPPTDPGCRCTLQMRRKPDA